MKALFFKYKSVLKFIGFFLGSYLLLSLCYGIYLKMSLGGTYHPDFVTNLVAKQSSAVISGFDYQSEVVPNQTEPNMILYINGTYLARIIEGCNSISIVILFMAFIIAFAQNRKKTIAFLFAGAVIIYAVNILRIVVLSILLYEYPQYSNVLHTVVFPGIIYGIVFLLWMIWVQLLNPVKAK